MSTDGSQKMLQEEFGEYKIILNEENVGFSRANNQALKLAKGKYILFLNPDTVIQTDVIPRMVEFLERNEEYGAIGCKLLNADGTVQYTCARTFPNAWNQFCHLSFLSRIFPLSKKFSNEDLEYWDHKNCKEVDVISGACLMARREIVEGLGGFDENIFMYSEDVDLCWRIKRSGFKIFYFAEGEILHYGGSSTAQRKDEIFVPLMLRKGQYYFVRKNYGQRKALLYRFAISAGLAIRLTSFCALTIINIAAHNKNRNKYLALTKRNLSLLMWSLGIKYQ